MELLFDDQWIDRKAGVRRVLGKGRKEQPILRQERPWEMDRIQACQSLMRDEEEGCFKLWYRAQSQERMEGGDDATAAPSERDHRKRRTFLCYATSRDGIDWQRPDLGRVAYGGRADTNIVHEASGRGDTVWWNILKDPDDPDPSRRYKGLGFHSRVDASTIRGVEPGRKGLFVDYSPDGINWRNRPRLVMDTNELTDANCMLQQREPSTGKWVGFFRPRTEPKRRFIGYCESDDFDRWTYPRMLLTPDRGDAEWVEFYGLSVGVFGRWRVGGLWVYHNNPEFSPMTCELVYSRDGLNYQRAMPGEQFVPLGAVGEWDSRCAWPVRLMQVGGEAFIYYNGGNETHGSDRLGHMQPHQAPPGERPVSGIGLARLPFGHFCGLRADQDGLVETKWLCNYGVGGIRLLADVPEDGSVRVELLDQHNNLVAGWDRDASVCRRTEHGWWRCHWGREVLTGEYGQQSDAGGRVGHVVKLRFHLRRATLYGFSIGEEGAGPEYVS